MITQRYRRWLRHALHNRSKIMGLRLTTTWRCNSKCTTCSIWQMNSDRNTELQVQNYDLLSRSKYLRDVEYITLSGGEPTLRDDLPEIVSVLHKNLPSATFGITVNGLNPDRTERLFRCILKANPDIQFRLVGLSLNGPPEIHDLTRGVQGSFDRVLETYDRIKNLVPCQFSFTFCRQNVQHFGWVQEFARRQGTSAYICWTVMNERFQVEEKDLVFWQSGMDDLLERFAGEKFDTSRSLTAIMKNLMTLPSGLVFACFYDNVVNKRRMPCYAGSQIVHIDPIGRVFPCNFNLSSERMMGNLKELDFDEIWENIDGEVLKEIRCAKCMYPNGLCGDSDIYPSLKNNPPFLVRWYLGKVLTKQRFVQQISAKGVGVNGSL